MRFEFPRTLGQEEAKERLRRALESGRFPHALLVHGEPGLGQHALLLDIAQILVCEHPEAKPCGACFSCKAFAASALETMQYLMPVAKRDRKSDMDDDDEGPEAGQLEELGESVDGWHRAPYGHAMPGKALVRMSQARDLIGRLRFSGTDGKARVVLVPWLEALGPEPANALLKILEEPPAGVYFLIASDHRSMLLQTLLSRCMHLGLAPLRGKEFRAAAEALASGAGRPGATPAPMRLLPFAEGSPGVYLDLLENGGEELLEEALGFLAAARSDWRDFADYAGAFEGGAEGAERVSRLLVFLLRMLRAARALHARQGAGHGGVAGGQADGYRWTARWDASLTPHLGAFEDIADAEAFATFLAEAHRAVRDYSKPSIALTGLFLEYEASVAARGSSHRAAEAVR
jgi:DNA polymerase III delta prime subunit